MDLSFGGMSMIPKVTEGQWTSTIYRLLSDSKLQDVVWILQNQLSSRGFQEPLNRAAMSILGYCYYNLQDFVGAASWYLSAFSLI
jgi:tetratricopeptide repeat protein 30